MTLATKLAAGLLLASVTASAAQDQAPADINYTPMTSEELVQLLDGCEDDSCMSYVAGAISGIAIYALIAEKPSPFCTTGEVEKADIRDAIISTVAQSPEIEDAHPAVAILTAFGRYWPCMTQEEMDAIEDIPRATVESETLADLMERGTLLLEKGPYDATPGRTMIVFHDPNCAFCQEFQDQTDALANDGWRILVYPVAITNENSAGYSAVQLALLGSHPETARALYEAKSDGSADIATAMSFAEESGVPTRDILTAIATSGAYEAVEENTAIFASLGGKGTPGWIVGNQLFSGFLTARTIENITAPLRTGEDAQTRGGTQ